MKTIKKIVMLLTAIVTLMNFINGRAESAEVITLHVELNHNIAFSQYGVTVYMDDQEIGHLNQGDQLTAQVCLIGSNHVLSFREDRNDKEVIATWQLSDLPNQCAISCKIKTCRNTIEVKDVTIRTANGEIVHTGFDLDEINAFLKEMREILQNSELGRVASVLFRYASFE